MSRRRGSATALNASEVVAALAMLSIYSNIGICQALFYQSFRHPFLLCCVPLKMGLSQVTVKPEVMPPGWQIAPDKRPWSHASPGTHLTLEVWRYADFPVLISSRSGLSIYHSSRRS